VAALNARAAEAATREAAAGGALSSANASLETARRDLALREVESKRLAAQISDLSQKLASAEAAMAAAPPPPPPPVAVADAEPSGKRHRSGSAVRPSLGSVNESVDLDDEPAELVSMTLPESPGPSTAGQVERINRLRKSLG